MQQVTPYKVKEVIFQRQYPGYLYRREIIDDSAFGGDGNLEMVNCYSADTGYWMGNAEDARFLCKKHGLRQVQIAQPDHIVCSIGFNVLQQKWYGWSHRAICSFGIGDKLFNGWSRGADDKELIATVEQAKQSAICFAASVS